MFWPLLRLIKFILQMKLEDLLPNKKTAVATEFPDYLLNDPEIVGYPDREMQMEVYRWVWSELYKNNADNYVLKDFGAGRGDLYTKSDYGLIYHGYEILPNLVDVGKFKYRDSTDFYLHCKDFITEPLVVSDFTVCIGTLNSIPTSTPWQLFQTTLQRALETTTQKIIFVLNDYNEHGFNSFPISQLQRYLPDPKLPFDINMEKYEDIYMLTLHVGGFKL